MPTPHNAPTPQTALSKIPSDPAAQRRTLALARIFEILADALDRATTPPQLAANTGSELRASGRVASTMSDWRSAITVHPALPPSTTRAHLNALADQAARLAETDPNSGRRARHKKLLRYLSKRVARATVRGVGRFENGKNNCP